MVETENPETIFLEVFIMKQKIQLSIQGNLLTVSPSSAPAATFDFPAAAISVRGERFEAKTPVAPPEKLKSGIWKAVYADGPFRFTVTVTPGKGDWFFKEVEVVSEKCLPTPDYLEVDCQTLPAPGCAAAVTEAHGSILITSPLRKRVQGWSPDAATPL